VRIDMSEVMCELSMYPNSELSSRIDENIHSARNRNIMKRKVIDGITYEQIAEEVNLSPRQVKNIVHKSVDLLIK
jgi:DNA-binding Lrp family transcriptional regulator